MRMNSSLLRLLACSLWLLSSSTQANRFSLTPEVGLESRYFPQSPAYAQQFSGVQASLLLNVDGRWVSTDRKQRIKFEPFLRLDSRDAERSHFDLRELNYSQRFGDWDVLLGNGQIFWGVAESRNVVDVINQFDTVENSDETDKLGQPLLRLGKFTDIGRFEAYYLPYFRERTFPGVEGRQRVGLVVDTDNAQYERGGEEFAGDFALRYSHQIDQFDLGLHLFHGTSRSPLLRPSADGTRLIPFYQELTQGGLDLQWTSEAWLLKLEAVGARMGGEDVFSLVTGYEYTFFDVRESGIDVGILTEYLYDNRDETRTPLTLFENDVFIGTRLAWNDISDTELLAGVIVDVDTGALFGSVEFERRLGENYLLEVEAQFLNSPDDDPLSGVERDSNLTLRLTRYF